MYNSCSGKWNVLKIKLPFVKVPKMGVGAEHLVSKFEKFHVVVLVVYILMLG